MTSSGVVAIESPRDLEESAFTPILRTLLHAVPGVLAVVFVDGEGECIDYCSALPPFDAKVIGAQMVVVGMQLRATSLARSGEPYFLHVHASDRDLLMRRVDAEYGLVVVSRSMGLSSMLEESVEIAVRDLRLESGVAVPPWEPAGDRVRVEVRLSTVGWSYAPKAFWQRGERIAVTDVLGRWVEIDDGGAAEGTRVCFLVRDERGHELTLVHFAEVDAWERR